MHLRKNGDCICILRVTLKMHISYNDRTDLLYIRLDDKKQDVINRRVSDDVVLDIGEGDKIIGVETTGVVKRIRRAVQSEALQLNSAFGPNI